MTGFLMCPKCGSFIEVHEVSRVVICPQCGTKHKLPASANKSYCEKENYNSLSAHTFMQNFKHVYVTSERKSHAVKDYRYLRFKRGLFKIACEAMKNGNFSKALNIFGVFPDFPEAAEKAEECRRAISQSAYNEASTRRKHAEFMKNYESPQRTRCIIIALSVALQGLVMWIIFKILGALM